MSADTTAESPDGLKHPGIHIHTNALDLQLAPGTDGMTTNELRDMMNAKFKRDLGIGNPSKDAFPSPEKEAEYEAQANAQYGDEIGNYGPTQGELTFREAIAEYYASRGMEVDPSHVVVVNGAQEALAIASMVFVTPKRSSIVTTDPTYIGFMQPNKLRDPEYVPFDPNQPESLRAALRSHTNVAMIYDQPILHNPLTITQTPDQRREIAEIAAEASQLLLRDMPYLELVDEAKRPVPTSDAETGENVVDLGSMSKMYKPALRVGWAIIKDPKIRDLFIQIKQGLNIATSRKDQALAEAFLRDPDRDAHLARVRALYTERGNKAIAAARRHLPAAWTEGVTYNGGMFLAFQNKKSSATTREITEQAKRLGLAVVPFEIFSPSRTAQGLRTNGIINTVDITDDSFQLLGQAIEIAENK